MAAATEESSDEELYILALYAYRPWRPRVFREHSNPMTDYTDEEFRMRLRLSKHTAIELLHRVENRLRYTSNRLGSLPPVHQLLLALRFYSSGSFQVLITFITLRLSIISCICMVIRHLNHVKTVIRNLYLQFKLTHILKQ